MSLRPRHRRTAFTQCCPWRPRFIGDSQTQYWYLAVECFLSVYLTKPPRAAPTNNSAANLWLVKFDEWRDLKGSPKASPKPSVCAELRVSLSAFRIVSR